VTYSFRRFVPSDVPVLAEMGLKFFRAGSLPGTFNPQVFAEFWTETLSGGVGIVLLLLFDDEPVGTIGGIVFSDPCTGDIIAQETFWWVDEEHRGSPSAGLITIFESEAKRRGAQRVAMSAIVGLKHRALARFYGGRGYRPLEHSFVKEV